MGAVWAGYISKLNPKEYRYASLNDGDTFWEMRR